MADSSFADLLRKSPARLWEAGRWWSMSELISAAPPLLEPLDAPVVVNRESVARMVQHLLAVDGQVLDLILRPADMPEDECQQLFDETASKHDVVESEEERNDTRAGTRHEDQQESECRAVACDVPVATRWHLATSGTTARPRLIPHTLASLSRSVRPAYMPPRRWGLVYDPARMAGFQVLLQALLGGEELVVLPVGYDQVAIAVQMAVDALSATPSWWRRLALQGFPANWNLRQITLGGEIADQSLLDHLRKAFPSARIHHIYASTEAGAGFAVGDGEAGFPATYLREGVAGLSLRIGEDGHLWLRPPAADWLDSGDVVEQRGERIYFLGRATGVINVGGNKVHPEAVESVLCAHALVAAARVCGKSNPVLGQVVHAEVLLAAKIGDDWRDTLRQHCHMNLAPHQVPAIISLMNDLQLGPAGKVVRHD